MKIVLQDGMKDCGICCLLSIIRFYGGDVSKEYLREITYTTKEGVSLYQLMEAAKKIGFDAVGLTGTLENIKINNLPCIAHIIINKNFQHFVVIYQINQKKKQVVLMDPSKGKKTISFSEYNLLASSNYLFLKPIKKLPVMKKKNIIYKNIRKLFQSNQKLLLFVVLLTFSYFVFNIITSFHFKYILEYSIHDYNLKNLQLISSVLLSFYILKNCNIYLRNILLNKWTSIFDYETTSLTYKQILLLPYLYYKNRTTGEVVSRFKDLNTVRTFISNFFCVMTTDFPNMILFFFLLFRFQKNLSWIILGMMSGLVLLTFLFHKKKKKDMKEILSGQDTIHSYLIQGISNVDTIKGSHLEKRLMDKFSINYKCFLERVYQYSFFHEIYSFLKNNIYDGLNVFIYGMGSYYVIKEELSLSSLIVYQTFFLYFSSCFTRVLSIFENYHSYKIALDRVEELFLIQEEYFKNNYYYLPYQLDGDIIIKNLNYRIGGKILFQNLSLVIKKGEKVLFNGTSGIGKSTLLKMLVRYIETDYGTISISNIDINHYHLENIRSNITYVSSEEYLFTDTLRNNITLYKEYKEEEIERVCKLCMVNELFQKSVVGLDSMIEENGFNFSHGERQRIILARSILKKSNIYIFDEALSGIDVEKEKIILKNIFSYQKEKTIIVISHRFNNQYLFDRVITLKNGRIYEKQKL